MPSLVGIMGSLRAARSLLSLHTEQGLERVTEVATRLADAANEASAFFAQELSAVKQEAAVSFAELRKLQDEIETATRPTAAAIIMTRKKLSDFSPHLEFGFGKALASLTTHVVTLSQAAIDRPLPVPPPVPVQEAPPPSIPQAPPPPEPTLVDSPPKSHTKHKPAKV